nr:integrase, catalytic region, zinc finger, CCHC-type, peptidase aspartic, catalytic [Tanacetum cinerariifolium]
QGGAQGKQRVITCYNCKGEGHMSKLCTKPKRKHDAEWFKDKVLLVQAQANGQVLQEEELEFLADPGTLESSSNQIVVTTMQLIKQMTWMRFLPEVYALVSNHKVTKELWERIQLLMQGTSLMKRERECKLYDEFDKFAYKKGESLLNTKFLNTLPPKWRKFMTDVKVVRDLHTTNVDQLHAYLGQHEFHANEYGSPYQSLQYGSQTQSSTPLSITYPPNDFQSSVHHNVYNPSSSIPQVEYAPLEQVETIQGIRGLLSAKTAKEKDTCQNNVLSQRGKGMSHDLGIAEAQSTQNVITHNAAYQADDLEPMTLIVMKSILPRLHSWRLYLPMVLMILLSDSNIIPYSQYMSESQHTAIQNSNFPAQQDELILYVIAQLKTQVVKCTKINLKNKNVNETLTAELEIYKDQMRILKEGNNVDKVSDSCA